MRIFVTGFILIISRLYAQPTDYLQQVNIIAASEQSNHAGIFNSSTSNYTAASNNFDIKYYRCEWDVDPGIRFIKGRVTIYYTVTEETNSISLDLINELTADSVKQQDIILEKNHSNNVLKIKSNIEILKIYIYISNEI